MGIRHSVNARGALTGLASSVGFVVSAFIGAVL